MKHTVQLKVGVETRLSWSVMRESSSMARTHDHPVLELTEGDHLSVACVAGEGFPVMQFSWEHHVVPGSEVNNSRPRTGREYQVRKLFQSEDSLKTIAILCLYLVHKPSKPSNTSWVLYFNICSQTVYVSDKLLLQERCWDFRGCSRQSLPDSLNIHLEEVQLLWLFNDVNLHCFQQKQSEKLFVLTLIELIIQVKSDKSDNWVKKW